MTSSVSVMDVVTMPEHRVEEWLQRWRSDYLPGARARGMRIDRQWRRFTAHHTVSLVILWEVPGIYEFYRMRATAAAAPEVARFWTWTDSLAVSRERRVLGEAS